MHHYFLVVPVVPKGQEILDFLGFQVLLSVLIVLLVQKDLKVLKDLEVLAVQKHLGYQ